LVADEVDGRRLVDLDDLWAIWDGGPDMPGSLRHAFDEARPVEEGALTLRASSLRPEKVLCIGRNYRAHAAETGSDVPTVPIVFNKFPSTLTASGATVPHPPATEQLDYEGELVVVMGRRAFNVRAADALSYVAGYTVGNDLSARDLQNRTSQWLLGKSLPAFGPIGPVVVTRDELPDPAGLDLALYRNGERVQHASTDLMVFDVPTLIEYISHILPLRPGDVIFTGTPDGVILGKPVGERRWLQPGDRLEVTIERIGTLVTLIGEPGLPAGEAL
jgi:2-keto-4-pentenoate hydratase/2-oxohepta-3-ene-1,7-dioic acid hydratase in catechol pathway